MRRSSAQAPRLAAVCACHDANEQPDRKERGKKFRRAFVGGGISSGSIPGGLSSRGMRYCPTQGPSSRRLRVSAVQKAGAGCGIGRPRAFRSKFNQSQSKLIFSAGPGANVIERRRPHSLRIAMMQVPSPKVKWRKRALLPPLSLSKDLIDCALLRLIAPYCQDGRIDDTSSRFFGSPAASLARAETVNRYLSSLAPCRRTKLLVTKCRLSHRLGSIAAKKFPGRPQKARCAQTQLGAGKLIPWRLDRLSA